MASKHSRGHKRTNGSKGRMLLTVPDEEIERVRNGEVSQSEMARQYGVSRQAIFDRLHYPPKGVPKMRRWLVYFLYLKGFTSAETAKELGYAKTTIVQILREK